MIKLLELLNEIESSNSPSAIFLAGPAGSGKSFISQKVIPSSLIVINIDDEYEKMLKDTGLGLNQKDFSPEELSQAAKLMGQARKLTNQKYEELTNSLKDVVIDGTGGSSNVILKKKSQLEDLGYKTFMLMLYVSPLTSLKRNSERTRSLMPSIILRTWRDVVKNIDIFSQAFNPNFSLINNNPDDVTTDFSQELIDPYFEDSKAVGKPKTPEELEKKEKEKEELNQEIKLLSQNVLKGDTLDQAKSKINKFLNE